MSFHPQFHRHFSFSLPLTLAATNTNTNTSPLPGFFIFRPLPSPSGPGAGLTDNSCRSRCWQAGYSRLCLLCPNYLPMIYIMWTVDCGAGGQFLVDGGVCRYRGPRGFVVSYGPQVPEFLSSQVPEMASSQLSRAEREQRKLACSRLNPGPKDVAATPQSQTRVRLHLHRLRP